MPQLLNNLALPLPNLPRLTLPPQQPLGAPPQAAPPGAAAAPPPPQQAPAPAAFNPSPVAPATYQDTAGAAIAAGRRPPPPQPGDVFNGHQFVGGNPAVQTAWKPLTGDDFLKTLAPTDANVVRALAAGRLAIPGGFASKSPYWLQKIQQATQFDPTLDQATYPTRLKTANAFVSGKEGQNIAAINTAISHMGQFASRIPAVAGHGGFPFATSVNGLINSTESGMGDVGIKQYQVDQAALSHELRRVFTVTGAGSEADLQNYMNQLSPDASTEQKQAAVREIVGLLAGRRDALRQQYENGMGTAKFPIEFSTPHADSVLQQWGGDGSADWSGSAPPARRAQPTPQSLPRKGGPMKVGRFTVEPVN